MITVLLQVPEAQARSVIPFHSVTANPVSGEFALSNKLQPNLNLMPPDTSQQQYPQKKEPDGFPVPAISDLNMELVRVYSPSPFNLYASNLKPLSGTACNAGASPTDDHKLWRCFNETGREGVSVDLFLSQPYDGTGGTHASDEAKILLTINQAAVVHYAPFAGKISDTMPISNNPPESLSELFHNEGMERVKTLVYQRAQREREIRKEIKKRSSMVKVSRRPVLDDKTSQTVHSLHFKLSRGLTPGEDREFRQHIEEYLSGGGSPRVRLAENDDDDDTVDADRVILKPDTRLQLPAQPLHTGVVFPGKINHLPGGETNRGSQQGNSGGAEQNGSQQGSGSGEEQNNSQQEVNEVSNAAGNGSPSTSGSIEQRQIAESEKQSTPSEHTEMVIPEQSTISATQQVTPFPDQFVVSGNTFGIGGEDEKLKEFIHNTIIPHMMLPRLLPKNQWHATKPLRGGILSGFPGTGKTLFISVLEKMLKNSGYQIIIRKVSGPDIFQTPAGKPEETIRSLFARDNLEPDALLLILIDELDALLGKRGIYREGAGMNDNVASQLLSEIQGLKEETNTLIFGATNRPDLIDPAATRAGRMDMKIHFTLPNREARKQILEIHTRDLCNSESLNNVDLDTVTARTIGFTGAELQALVRRAIAFSRARAQRSGVGDIFFSISAINQLNASGVTAQDFNWALTQVKPQFGSANFIDLEGKNLICDYIPRREVYGLITQTTKTFNNPGLATLRILVVGPPAGGKSTFAALILQQLGVVHYCQYVTAADVIELSDDDKKKFLVNAFNMAQDARVESDKKVGIVLDDFDVMIGSQGGRPYNEELVAVLEAHSKQPLNVTGMAKLLIIVTASEKDSFLPGLFEEDNIFTTHTDRTREIERWTRMPVGSGNSSD